MCGIAGILYSDGRNVRPCFCSERRCPIHFGFRSSDVPCGPPVTPSCQLRFKIAGEVLGEPVLGRINGVAERFATLDTIVKSYQAGAWKSARLLVRGIRWRGTWYRFDTSGRPPRGTECAPMTALARSTTVGTVGLPRWRIRFMSSQAAGRIARRGASLPPGGPRKDSTYPTRHQ